MKARLQAHLADHIATCPRCQKRLAMTSRVHLALDLIKSQPHSLYLLAAANTRATGVLKHSLRDDRKSEKLRHQVPDRHWLDKQAPLIERILNVAACLFVLCMVRMGLTASLTDVQEKGRTAVHGYYARHLDGGLLDELFPDGPPDV